MAKKKTRSGGPNKSAAIRDYYNANPDAMPKDVAEALGAKGLDVSAQFVSTIRSKQLKSQGASSRRGKAGRPKGTAAKKRVSAKRGRSAAATGGDVKVSIDELVQAKEMVDALGGMEKARRTLDALSQIVD